MRINFKNAVLLDIGSNLDTFCNKKLIMSIKRAKNDLKNSTNVGKPIINKQGEVTGYGNVW